MRVVDDEILKVVRILESQKAVLFWKNDCFIKVQSNNNDFKK